MSALRKACYQSGKRKISGTESAVKIINSMFMFVLLRNRYLVYLTRKNTIQLRNVAIYANEQLACYSLQHWS